ncbi:MAG: lysophospholipid acyltransferase family protein [bacterium]
MAYGFLRRSLIPKILRRIQVEGVERLPASGPFLLASNHVSYLEPILLSMLLIQRTGQRVYSLTKYPVWKFFHTLGLAEWLGMICVPRVHREGVVEDTLKKLRAGFPVIIFPEGTRSFDGTLGRAKTGIARLALRSGAPVVPVGYIGRPGRTTLDTFRNYFAHRKEIRIRIGEPRRYAGVAETHEEYERITGDVMASIALLAGRTYAKK